MEQTEFTFSHSPEEIALLQPYFEDFARIIADALDIAEGDHVLIAGGVHQVELLHKIALYAQVKGSYPDVRLASDELQKRRALEVPEKYLNGKPTQHDRYMATLFNEAIFIDSVMKMSHLDDIPPHKKMLGAQKTKELSDLRKARNSKSLFMAWPTAEKAASCSFTFPEFAELFIKAMMVNRDIMTDQGQRIKKHLKNGGTVEITSQKGSHFTFELLPERRVMIDTGCFTAEMVAEGDITKNLPCGEVYTTPCEPTVSGTAIFDLVFAPGYSEAIKDLKLTFCDGRLIEYEAAHGISMFEEYYNQATGDRDKLAELGIGINPALTRAIGDTLLDEKIFGSVHLALGESRMYGGTNNASIHWDLVMQNPTLTVAGTTIIDKGEFTDQFE